MTKYLFITISFAIWGILNLYIGWRGWQGFGRFTGRISLLYWFLFFLLVFSFFIGRFANNVLPGYLSKIFTWFGSYWLAAFVYMLVILLLIDIVRILDHWLHFIPAAVKNSPGMVAFTTLGVLLLLMIYGTINARDFVVTSYNITIPKTANIDQLHVIMVSDLHLGDIVDNNRLKAAVEEINRRQPDLILFVGDIVDDDVASFKRQQMDLTLNKLEAELGKYAVLGNHEYIGGQWKKTIADLEAAGITVLRDQYKLIADSFYLVGRDDIRNENRSTLEKLISGIDKSRSVILMDHNPSELEEGNTNQIDLQLSGHTHRGQFAPLNLVTNKMYEVDWGYLQKDHMQVIVSNGFGTWGPPIRIGNKGEIVEIFIKFVPK